MEKIAFYAEADPKIGIGHVVRLKNTQNLIKNKKIVWFFSGDKKFADSFLKKYYYLNKIDNKNFTNTFDKILRKEKINKIFVDIANRNNLKNSKSFEKFFKFFKKKNYFLISFDDPRLKILSDISIIPYVFDKKKIIVENKNVKKIHGKKYFFSSPYFNFYKKKNKVIKKKIKKIFIFLTGYNTSNSVKDILKNFSNTKYDITIYSNGSKIINNNKNIRLIGFRENLAKLYFDSDVAIVGEGLSRYETALLGVPTVLIYSFEALKRTNDLAWKFIRLKTSKVFTPGLSFANLKFFIESKMTYPQRKILSNNAKKFFDLNGAARFSNIIKKFL
jgi:spore coat polysaccharide biosynthesis predicted glycosyltransferase SpsG